MTLGEMFARGRGRPVDLEGRTIHGIYRRSLTGKQRVILKRIGSISDPVQGISLGISKGKLGVNGQTLSDIVLALLDFVWVMPRAA